MPSSDIVFQKGTRLVAIVLLFETPLGFHLHFFPFFFIVIVIFSFFLEAFKSEVHMHSSTQ